MEKLLLNQPAKIRKRKTRKCLNELRKRSKASIGFSNKIDLSVESKNIYNLKKELTNNKLSNIATKNTAKITTERLTMKRGIFAKGVRSETVTRPALPEVVQARMDEDLYKIIDLANGEPKCTVTSNLLNNSNGDLQLNFDHKPILSSNEMKLKCPKISHITGTNQTQDSNSDDYNKIESLITSIPLTIEQEDSGIKKPVIYYKSIDSDSSSELGPDVALTHYNLYKEFCDKVPHYLEDNFPIAANMNIEDDIKKYLKKVYAKSCQRESADNILDCIRNHNVNTRPKVETNLSNGNIIKKTMKESILLNPIQYLKSVQHNIMQQSHSIVGPNDESTSMVPGNNRSFYHTMRNNNLDFPRHTIHDRPQKRYMSSTHAAKDYITRYHNKIAKILNSPEKRRNILRNENMSNESSSESDFGNNGYGSKNSNLVNINSNNNVHTYNIMKNHHFS